MAGDVGFSSRRRTVSALLARPLASDWPHVMHA
jgi:hypothetical protein